MNAKVIPIGNSKGVRLPKALLDELNIKNSVRLEARAEGIMIIPIDEPMPNDLLIASENSLAKTWDDPREDEAWRNL